MTLYMGNNLVAGGFDMVSLLDQLYPVGSVYLTTSNANTCPLQVMGVGTWTLESNNNRALWVGNGSNGGTTIAQSLPNVSGTITFAADDASTGTNTIVSSTIDAKSNRYCSITSSVGRYYAMQKTISLNSANSTYSTSNSTVQPPAYVVNVWRRTA